MFQHLQLVMNRPQALLPIRKNDSFWFGAGFNGSLHSAQNLSHPYLRTYFCLTSKALVRASPFDFWRLLPVPHCIHTGDAGSVVIRPLQKNEERYHSAHTVAAPRPIYVEARAGGTRGLGRATGLPGAGRIPRPPCFIVELAGNKHQTVPRNAWFADVPHVP